MITAVDTNIILDILIPGEPFAGASKKLLDRHLSKGKLILSEVVFAELSSQFPAEEELKTFLTETGMRLVYSNEKSLYVAGARWAVYAKKSSKDRFACAKTNRLHVLADFLIGAHALANADCLLSRDLGLYKAYFSDLKVVGHETV